MANVKNMLCFGLVLLLVAGVLVVVSGCNKENGKAGKMGISKQAFGKADGKDVDIYTLTNDNGMEIKITNYGGIVTSIKVPDSKGNIADVALGYDNLDDYIKNKNNPYFGAIIGRYGNRIGDAKFTLDGKEYALAKNNGPNNLHGGNKGFDKVVWDAKPFEKDDVVGLTLKYTSEDGEEGFPGNLDVTVVYTLTNDNEIKIHNEAVTDEATIVNLTHHSYFNLKGQGNSDILGHLLMINAAQFTPVDETLITTGEIVDVEGTPMDFTKPTAIGKRIEADDEQLKFGKGYDHNWVLNREDEGPALAARVKEPETGRVLEVYTTAPGLQFYSGNFLDGTNVGKGGAVYNFRNAFCLEPQFYPDTPNKPEFPSCVLRPGEIYEHDLVYKFSAE